MILNDITSVAEIGKRQISCVLYIARRVQSAQKLFPVMPTQAVTSIKILYHRQHRLLLMIVWKICHSVAVVGVMLPTTALLRNIVQMVIVIAQLLRLATLTYRDVILLIY